MESANTNAPAARKGITPKSSRGRGGDVGELSSSENHCIVGQGFEHQRAALAPIRGSGDGRTVLASLCAEDGLDLVPPMVRPVFVSLFKEARHAALTLLPWHLSAAVGRAGQGNTNVATY